MGFMNHHIQRFIDIACCQGPICSIRTGGARREKKENPAHPLPHPQVHLLPRLDPGDTPLPPSPRLDPGAASPPPSSRRRPTPPPSRRRPHLPATHRPTPPKGRPPLRHHATGLLTGEALLPHYRHGRSTPSLQVVRRHHRMLSSSAKSVTGGRLRPGSSAPPTTVASAKSRVTCLKSRVHDICFRRSVPSLQTNQYYHYKKEVQRLPCSKFKSLVL
ncbi:proline-rich receptor-like protein kinase PERK10 [Triticum urartu]|uniref:proline-rich receptor-like protein kinase PERK10 n=1 Tax=Triticum urartu TaxID=4572 RepID=UPI00204330D8|nr:proline-rich receptor-like protein kinase PERK10 [Triticum urartu]